MTIGTVTRGERHHGLLSDDDKASIVSNSPKRSQEKEETGSPAKRTCLTAKGNRRSDEMESQGKGNDRLEQLIKDIEALTSRRETLTEANLDLLDKLDGLGAQLRASHQEMLLVVKTAGRRDLVLE